MEDWRGSLERDEIVVSVFVDLSKAFDSINHCLLLQKLALYGFWDKSLEWFRNYLSGRRQCVAYGDMSEWVNVCMGVPQGSASLHHLCQRLACSFVQKQGNAVC